MKTSIEIIKNKLESKLKGIVKTFYIGDPWLFPESSLPALIIAPMKTETDIIDNTRDTHVHFIDISLVIDARQYFGKMPNEVVGCSFLMDIMEKENSDGTLNDNSVLSILRNNINLGTNRRIQNMDSIEYTVRRRADDVITLEATVHIQIEYLLNR